MPFVCGTIKMKMGCDVNLFCVCVCIPHISKLQSISFLLLNNTKKYSILVWFSQHNWQISQSFYNPNPNLILAYYFDQHTLTFLFFNVWRVCMNWSLFFYNSQGLRLGLGLGLGLGLYHRPHWFLPLLWRRHVSPSKKITCNKGTKTGGSRNASCGKTLMLF